jgi:hypothetical protein
LPFMPFTEALKLTVKKKAHFSCCLCHSLGVEIHHVIPQEEGGPDTEDNAAPLCPSCHETYGANQQKRKFIKDVRDFWYEICEKRYASDIDTLRRIESLVQNVPSRDDLVKVAGIILDLQQSVDSMQSYILNEDQSAAQIEELHQRIREVEENLRFRAESLAKANERQAIAQVGIELALSMAKDRSDQKLNEATEAYSAAVASLVGLGEIESESFLQIFTQAFGNELPPTNPMHRILYYLSQQYKCIIQLSTSALIASSVVPTLLNEYDSQPDRPIPQLLTTLSARIRAGELDNDFAQRHTKMEDPHHAHHELSSNQ